MKLNISFFGVVESILLNILWTIYKQLLTLKNLKLNYLYTYTIRIDNESLCKKKKSKFFCTNFNGRNGPITAGYTTI